MKYRRKQIVDAVQFKADSLEWPAGVIIDPATENHAIHLGDGEFRDVQDLDWIVWIGTTVEVWKPEDFKDEFTRHYPPKKKHEENTDAV